MPTGKGKTTLEKEGNLPDQGGHIGRKMTIIDEEKVALVDNDVETGLLFREGQKRDIRLNCGIILWYYMAIIARREWSNG
jgi:hypothetical protein